MKNKVLIFLGMVAAFLLGTRYAVPVLAYAAQLYHSTFTTPLQAGVYSVGVTSTTVVSDVNTTRVFLSLDNSGSNGVSCYPVGANDTYAYGGGIWLAPNGGAVTFDSVTVMASQVVCLTGSGTTTVGVVESQ